MAKKKLTIKLTEDGLFAKGAKPISGTSGDTYSFWTLPEPCVYCGEPANTKEHVIPISVGGAKYGYNVVKACLECNTKRSSKPLLLYLLSELKL